MGLLTVHDIEYVHISLCRIRALVIDFPDFEVTYVCNFRSILLLWNQGQYMHSQANPTHLYNIGG